jgi:GNAT superfamily N-acetyltransferase
VPAYHQPSYVVRRAEPADAGLVSYLRLASLICFEMPSCPLDSIRAFAAGLPDADTALVASGRYMVADQSGDLIGGAGWSVLPLDFRADCLVEEDGSPTGPLLADHAVLVRGFFLDPDLGRRGVGANLLAHVEAAAARAGHPVAEALVPASAQVIYRSLGFKPVRRLTMRTGCEDLQLMQMRKSLAQRLAVAA